MARPIRLPASSQKLIGAAVDALFDRVKGRLLGPGAEKYYGKQLVFRFNPELSLTGLFTASSNAEGASPNEDVLKTLLKISGSYLDASRERTKARIIQQVSSFLADAGAQGIKTDVKTVLGGQLAELWGEVHADVRRIVETETTVTRNVALHDAIGRIATHMGVSDPTVFFIVVRDSSRCKECTRLHLRPDAVTPRVWKMSEVGSGYHKKGDAAPKVSGLHPHCRCMLTTLFPGYGFDAAGRVTYKEPGHDEFSHQRGFEKSEPLEKGLKQSQIKTVLKRFGWQEKSGGGHDMMEHPGLGAKIPFQRGYSGDYDWKWVDRHYGQAGLIRDRRGDVTPDPGHAFFSHYVRLGHAAAPQARKTWESQGSDIHLPIDAVELGDAPEGQAHADAVQKMKAGQTQDLSHVEVMDLGSGRYGTLSNHHLLQAAKDAGMTHVPVKLVKSQR